MLALSMAHKGGWGITNLFSCIKHFCALRAGIMLLKEEHLGLFVQIWGRRGGVWRSRERRDGMESGYEYL